MGTGENELVIRQAKLYDVPAISRIENATSGTPWSADAITQDVTSKDRAYVAAVVCGTEVIGYADMWIVAGEAQLNNIAIDEKFRGLSYGEQLLGHMISRAKELGCDSMTLEVRASNAAARSLYKKAGFAETAVRRRYYRDNNEDAILMTRDLLVEDVTVERTADFDIEIDVETR